MVEVGSVRIDRLASREVNGAMLLGSVDCLSSYTEQAQSGFECVPAWWCPWSISWATT